MSEFQESTKKYIQWTDQANKMLDLELSKPILLRVIGYEKLQNYKNKKRYQ